MVEVGGGAVTWYRGIDEQVKSYYTLIDAELVSWQRKKDGWKKSGPLGW